MKIIRRTIDIILIIIIIICIYQIVNKKQQYNEADKIYTQIEKEKEDGENFYNKNEDYRGWMKINNTNINYPILQGIDNNYYLDKDINKNYLQSGSIFMDYKNNNFNDQNTVIFGHYMKNKTMFGQLSFFKEQEFFNNNKTIEIETKDGEKINYTIFSVYTTTTDDNYIQTTFATDEEYKEFLDKIKNKSMYKSDIQLSEKDKIITLSTCSYETANSRLVVHGRRE